MKSVLLFPLELQMGPEAKHGITRPRIFLVVEGSNRLNPWGSGHMNVSLPSWN